MEEKQTKVSGEEGIREDQPNSVNAMSVICSQTTVSGEGGIREDRAHTANGKRTTVRDYVEAGRLENQPPSINAICVYTATFVELHKTTTYHFNHGKPFICNKSKRTIFVVSMFTIQDVLSSSKDVLLMTCRNLNTRKTALMDFLALYVTGQHALTQG